jgi:hypothetical protein
MSDWTVDEINSTAADTPKAQQAEAKLGDWSSNDIEQATVNPGETPTPMNVLEDVGKDYRALRLHLLADVSLYSIRRTY